MRRNSVRSDWEEVEVFFTTDGKVFTDDVAAEAHQSYLDQAESLEEICEESEWDVKNFVREHQDVLRRMLIRDTKGGV